MNRLRLILTASFLALGVHAYPAFAQSEDESVTPLPEQDLSEPAQSLASEEDPIASDQVDVSLGDWDVRTSISEQLDIAISDIPLTVSVEPDLASKICPVRESDLQQQEIVSAVRTCAAKSVNDDLLEAVRTTFEQPEAEELELAPAANGEANSQPDDGAESNAGSSAVQDTPNSPSGN